MFQLSGFEREAPVLKGWLLSSRFFLKSPVSRLSWLKCQTFMNFSSRSQFLQTPCENLGCYTLFYEQCFSSIQPQCCLTFSWIELQILPTCCLLHISIIILWEHISYLVYFRPCLGVGPFMSHIGDLFFIFSLIFVAINSIKS